MSSVIQRTGSQARLFLLLAFLWFNCFPSVLALRPPIATPVRRLSSRYLILTNEVRYVYDGIGVLQERDANNVPVATYTRGLDLSGSFAGAGLSRHSGATAGGVGGLLARSLGYSAGNWTTNFYYHADGNGNVTCLLSTNQTLVGIYQYDPYGFLLSSEGPQADINYYRFSSKEFHSNSGLYYFGFRYYDPNLQRWLNHDPIGEEGGMNLYGFVGNSPMNYVDPLGREVYLSPAQEASVAKGMDKLASIIGPPIRTALYVADKIQQPIDWAEHKLLESGNPYVRMASVPLTYIKWFGPGGKMCKLGQLEKVAAEERISYGVLDALGRPTGVSAKITEDILGTGTRPSSSIIPPGFEGGAVGQARGHLLGAQLGGSGDEVRNLVTILQNPANTPVMRGIENAAAAAVRSGLTLNYSAVPIYEGINAIPRGITIIISSGSGELQQAVTILNPIR